MIPRLGDSSDAPFPPVDQALDAPDGLLAWGGDLSPPRLERAYRSGIFPWYAEDEPLLWWSPGARCVFVTDRVHIARRLRRVLRQGRFRVTADRDFEAVISACATARDSTWITADIRAAYCRMHELGYAHSIEAWRGDQLAGGLYGLSFGRMFFGESMFTRVSDGGKVALVSLCRVLSSWAFPLLDAQVPSGHLEHMGAAIISRERFLALQAPLLEQPGLRGAWTTGFAAALDGADPW